MSSNTNAIGSTSNRSNIRTMIQTGMLGALAGVLMIFEIPLWFVPEFYKIDLSEVPVLIGTFAMGPLAGALIEFIKILLNFVYNGTTTAGIGELANFLIGCSLILPAGIIYKKMKSRKGALIGMITGTIVMVVMGCFLNAFILLPAYSKAFGIPVEAFVGMGSAVNSAITNLPTFVLLAVAPFNLLKGLIVSVITFILYRYVSPILKGNQM